ncbi:MAG: hypothetical protein NMK33_01125 [Candidatus Cardinium sp.]|uniref:hypothetical protein n=1 Tax=Cardinium endosymbiont of Dermatophagoides farinae TaxID=2597823 RepID=UPI001182B16C|nr:hypothetical protein [Cardinium endosymbiont of Dermatophagoides farinae]TSJ81113.1 hypothetical protein FPG78_03810 [Cardinium endosymbiont of Dermatophagoides farinae]UWW97155.1 MAG: hypothetical protein NMK33_01125 [Candidatus Cardinium sp.]
MIIVNKSIEKREMIGPLYTHEALLLVLFSMVSLFGLMVLNKIFKISKLWMLTCPALFFLLLILLRYMRKNQNPTYLFSWMAFHFKQPKYINAKKSKLCYKITI